MSIPDNIETGKGEAGLSHPQPALLLLPVFIILAGTLIWGSYVLAKHSSHALPVEIGTVALANVASSTQGINQAPISQEKSPVIIPTGLYVASRTGTAYYLPVCAAAKRISDKNKVWFDTKALAEKAGYVAAKNCKEMK